VLLTRTSLISAEQIEAPSTAGGCTALALFAKTWS
jgi:hypothetical protein